MKKAITILTAVLGSAVIFASPATAAKPDHPSQAKDAAAKQCAAEKKADKAAFKALYGKHAMRACVKAETPVAATELKNAAQECKAERSEDPAAFAEAYGEKKNALGKCVSAKSKDEQQADVEEFDNAAQQCKAERSEDPSGFEEQYGSAQSKGKNALGKCVSTKVKEAEAV